MLRSSTALAAAHLRSAGETRQHLYRCSQSFPINWSGVLAGSGNPRSLPVKHGELQSAVRRLHLKSLRHRRGGCALCSDSNSKIGRLSSVGGGVNRAPQRLYRHTASSGKHQHVTATREEQQYAAQQARGLASTPWWSGVSGSPPTAYPPGGSEKGGGSTDPLAKRHRPREQEREPEHQRQQRQQHRRGGQRRDRGGGRADQGSGTPHLEQTHSTTERVLRGGWMGGPASSQAFRWSGDGGGGNAAGGESQSEAVSSLVNGAIIRRLASSRRSKNWRSALGVLVSLEREAAAAATKPGGGTESWRLWCKPGLSFEAADRARTIVYNIVMDVLSARKLWLETFVLLENMQDRGVTADIYTLNCVLKACGSAGQIELMMALLREMRSIDTDGRGAGTGSDGGGGGGGGGGCGGGGGGATEVPPPRRLPWPDVVSFNIALAACARVGEASLALSLLDEMRAEAARSLSSSDDGHLPEAVLEEGADGACLSPAPEPNATSFNSALAACARGVSRGYGEGFQRALEIVEAMRARNEAAPAPTVVTYREMVNICGRAGRWEEALAWVDAAAADGFELDAAFFAAIITAMGREGEWERALSVLYEDMRMYGVFPDKFCLNMALRACADAGRTKEALEILDENLSGRRGANAFSYSSILEVFARQGKSELGLRLLREMEESEWLSPNAWHYGAVFLAHLKAGDEAGALAVQSQWREKQRPSPRPREGDDDANQTNSASERGRGGVIAAAEGLRARGSGEGKPGAMVQADRPLQPSDLPCRAAWHADAGEWKECLEILEVAHEVSRSTRAAVRVRANELLLGKTERGERLGNINATVRSGTAGAGLASWREVAARNSDATERADEAAKALRTCYEAAVEALGRAGGWDHALEVLQEGALVAARHGLSLDAACFVHALRACSAGDGASDGGVIGIENGKAEGADAGKILLDKMESEAGVVPDAWCSNVVLEAAVRAERWTLAYEVLDDIERRHLSSSPRGEGRGPGVDSDAETPLREGGHSEDADSSVRRESDHGDTVHNDEVRGDGVRAAQSPTASRGQDSVPAPPREYDRGPREMRRTAIDLMAPTALTYHLALKACAGEAASGGQETVERALSLVQKMSVDPHMGPGGESIALAKKVVATSADMATAIDIRRLETEAQERHESDVTLEEWVQRRNTRIENPVSERRWWESTRAKDDG